ncbi:hypothetical protein CALVIDRAFT_326271 [Calocera viscosa TUFC12733]|uniref:Uncharacterized protein n=1 Tax=Calocera viscosa (strain TUFC12733) TaxID=1330018 RepID=A0A167QU53_CALVF|nr:hypothetical protein CALVIDRAFT_326271 [Calocera viscosa TUFC12733]
MQFLQAFIVLVLLSFTRAAAIPESNIAIPERDLTLLSPTKRDMNVSTVMSNFQVVIMASSSLNNIVSSMSDSMSIDTVTTMGTTIVTDFTTIIGSLATDLAEMGETVFDDAAAGQIVPVLLEFVKIHCALLSTLIGKNGIFRQFLLTAPIAVVLKTLETGIDVSTHRLGAVPLI